MIIRLITVSCVFLMVAACGEPDLDSQLADLEDLAANNSFGGAENFWLSKQSIIDPTEWDKVALFFGMNDDEEFCYEHAEKLNKQYPRERWECFSANDN